MNKYLVAVYQGHPDRLDHLLTTTYDHDQNDLNAALSVVLQDTDRDVIERLRIGESLLVAGADPNSGGTDKPLLSCACAEGEELLVRLLLEYACDVNSCGHDNRRRSPLHIAASKGDENLSGILVEAGASTNAVDDDGCTPLMNALSLSNDKIIVKDLIRLLLVDYKDINSLNYFWLTPLHIAVQNGNNEAVQILLSNKASVEKVDEYGNTCLHAAILAGKLETVKLLVQAGSSLNALNSSKHSPIHSAIEANQMEIMGYLLDQDACIELDTLDIFNCSPLVHAVAVKTQIIAVKMLLQYNCDCSASVTDAKVFDGVYFKGTVARLAMVARNWPAFHMLRLAGGKLSSDDLYSFKLLSQNFRNKLLDTIDRLEVEMPLSLHYLCRIAIRKSFNKTEKFNRQLQSLNLPKSVTDFLKMKDLDDIMDEYIMDE